MDEDQFEEMGPIDYIVIEWPGRRSSSSSQRRSSASSSWYVSETNWIDREPAPADPTQITEIENPLAAYTVINARVGWRFFRDRLDIGLVGTNLGTAHAEHPFGNLIERRFFGTVTVTP